jgi:hypothetical protein
VSDDLLDRLRALDPAPGAGGAARSAWGEATLRGILDGRRPAGRRRRWTAALAAVAGAGALVALFLVLIVSSRGTSPTAAGAVARTTFAVVGARPSAATLDRTAELIEERAGRLRIEGVTASRSDGGVVIGLPRVAMDRLDDLIAPGRLRIVDGVHGTTLARPADVTGASVAGPRSVRVALTLPNDGSLQTRLRATGGRPVAVLGPVPLASPVRAVAGGVVIPAGERPPATLAAQVATPLPIDLAQTAGPLGAVSEGAGGNLAWATTLAYAGAGWGPPSGRAIRSQPLDAITIVAYLAPDASARGPRAARPLRLAMARPVVTGGVPARRLVTSAPRGRALVVDVYLRDASQEARAEAEIARLRVVAGPRPGLRLAWGG